MTIQWFPGHMAKARRQVAEKLKLVDIVFELLDARLPLSSRNPMMDEIVKNKPRLILLTKCDLADERVNKEWVRYFQEKQIGVLPIDAQTGKGVGQIQRVCEQVLQDLFAKREKKGIQLKRVRAMVLGIPNVGKSSLINRLAKRNAAKTGDRPGVTKAQQWIRVGQTLELLDTPGILWPKFDDQQVGMRLAVSGAIKEEILPLDEVALYAIEYLTKRYPHLLQERYKLTHLPEAPVELLAEIGKKRGCLQRGGEIDYDKAIELFLNDIRSGRLGRISFEWPEDWEEKEEEHVQNNDHSTSEKVAE
ncbi:ribosome biogenesis GTPase YlqF [Thermoflavimicrobium dichotomicum]|uniref:Ribosome biogenesis GTPase A n=1 Tax=Thermoflavimicrobium dichotomicum TaxID=46223 RepID=A0A1I3UC97_9BACL|nr:ribosome biogenesis GTPase YlqF [Thermoflavimicrobium dichotomicum]SFJ80343.1 ribosome biogenesis GTPase A [Thermoflavimicrobium dichotomicum]